MKFTTELNAVDPRDGGVKKWMGPYIEAQSFEEAEQFIKKHGMGYLIIIGKLEEEINVDKEEEDDIMDFLKQNN